MELRKKAEEQRQPSSTQSLSFLDEAEVSSEAAYTASFISQNAPYLLRDSFILDSGATTHICNNRQRFEDFVQASDYLVAGDGQVRVEGYGTVRIKLSRPSGEISIKLAKVALIPDFQTNTVSLQRLKAKGIS